jgi:hypothetical protein
LLAAGVAIVGSKWLLSLSVGETFRAVVVVMYMAGACLLALAVPCLAGKGYAPCKPIDLTSFAAMPAAYVPFHVSPVAVGVWVEAAGRAAHAGSWQDRHDRRADCRLCVEVHPCLYSISAWGVC